MRFVSIYGSPTPPGKLARAMSFAEEHVGARAGWQVQRLAPRPGEHFVAGTWTDEDVEAVKAADAVLVASPVFRGSIPGVLKVLIDMLPVEALRDTPVAILTVGAAPHHFLSAERHLRDLLSWFGALAAPNAGFFVDKVFAGEEVDPEDVRELEQLVDQVVVLAERLEGSSFGPDPLTVRFSRRHPNN